MRHVNQRYPDKGDCGIACLAMVAGVSYQDSLEAFFACGLTRLDGNLYTLQKHLVLAAEHLGIQCKVAALHKWRPFAQTAIVKVNRTPDNYWHWVVHSIDRQGQFVFDPDPNKPYKVRDFRGLGRAGKCIIIA